MTQSIVLQVCKEMGVEPADFFGRRRDQRLVSARRLAIDRLVAAGFSMRGVSRMMRRNYSTVQYWMRPALREKRRETARNYWAVRREVSA